MRPLAEIRTSSRELIRTFRLEASGTSNEGDPRELWPIARRKLDQIDAVTRLDELRVPPGNRFPVYFPGSIPWDLMTPIATGLLRIVIRSLAASSDLALTLMPPVNVM